MRYRLKVVDEDRIFVQNVETGLIVGRVDAFLERGPLRHQFVVSGCSFYDNEGVEIANVPHTQVANPLRLPAVSIAFRERDNGYRTFQANADQPVRPDETEQRLGFLLAQASAEMARGVLEYQNGGLRADTKNNFGALIAEVHSIRAASYHGSFDDKVRQEELYFSGSSPSGPRMTFTEAAEYYGLRELRKRHPDLGDETLKVVLAWPLDLLRSLSGNFDSLALRPKMPR
jgi:hypothetical protein